LHKKIRSLGIIAALLSAVALLSSCAVTPTDTSDTASTGSSTSSFLIMIGFIVVLFVLMYFLTIRPQKKRQKEQANMMNNLQRGDKVITIGGLMGNVESVSEDSIVIKVDGGTTMRFLKSAIATKVTNQADSGSTK
jgi:preprotein translocase subunit YajC